jgi:hypothetical protein
MAGGIHFDHLPGAFLVVFQCMTCEGWTDIMYMLQDAHSDYFASVYFCALILLTSFFLLNVALAVVGNTFEALSAIEDQQEEEEEKEKEEAARAASPDAAPKGDALVAPEEAEKDGRSTPESKSVRQDSDEEIDYSDEAPWLNITPVRGCRAVAFSEAFTSTIMFFILANVVTMCLDKHPPPGPVLRELLRWTELIFTVAFTAEMAIMLAAVGPRNYVTNPVMCFDGIIVVASLVEMSMDGGGGAIRAMRGFRLLRIFKLAKKWTSFRILLKSMIQTCLSLGNFTLLLVLMLYVFTLMGMNFFALKFHFEGGDGPKIPGDSVWCPGGEGDVSCVPRAHFDTFLWAFVTIFQIMSGENWNTVMYDGMKAIGWPAVFFFLALIIVGQCIIFNLFLAILMSKFGECSQEIREQEASQKAQNKKLKEKQAGQIGTTASGSPASKTGFLKVVNAAKSSPSNANVGQEPLKHNTLVNETENTMSDSAGKSDSNEPEATAEATAAANGHSPKASQCKVVPVHGDLVQTDDVRIVEQYIWPRDYAFLLFSPSSDVRVFCKKTVARKQFDNLILACILVSSFCMALDDPRADPSSTVSVFLRSLNNVFSVVFLSEMLMKQVAFGLIIGKGAYWRNSWNVLDGTVVVISIIDWAAADSGMTMLKTLRILRAFRPLRVVSKRENLRLVVNTLFKSVPELFNLLIVAFLFFLIFGLFALGYFKGGFNMCAVAGDGGVEEFAYQTKFNFQNVYDSNGTLVTRTAPGYFNGYDETYTSVMNLNSEMTPVCVSPDGVLKALGEIDSETSEFVVGGNCDGVHYQRPSRDTPICTGHCDARSARAIDMPKVPGGLCPLPLTRAEELPSVCDDAEHRQIAFREALKSGPVELKEEDEAIGTKYFEAMRRQVPMACSADPSTGFKGCRETYCPDGHETEPTEDERKSCEAECDSHPIFCADACKSGGPACDACKKQCQAACECPRFCDANVFEAATCVEQGGQWMPSLSQSFDNIFESMMTLFEISTTEGWVDVMYAASDSMGPYMEPKRDENEIFAGLFFCLFILVGTFFLLNLCVGVIVDNFNNIKEGGGSLMMTEAQENWVNTQRNFLGRRQFFGLTELDSKSVNRVKAYYLVNSSATETFIMVCILLNTVLMGCKQFPTPSKEYAVGMQSANYCFAVIFLLEAAVKLFALRENYFQDGWNIFDFCCVCATLLGFIIDQCTSIEIGAVMSAIRIFRIARLFRLVRFAKGLNRLFTAFVLSIPRLLNVVAILVLLLFLFSVLGVRLFALIKFDPNGGPHDGYANFQDFYRAFMTLVRCMTGEGWNELMHSLSRDEKWFTQTMGGDCYDSRLLDGGPETWRVLKAKCIIDKPNACGTDLSYVYFMCYTWAITFVILNLVIAVILEGFDDSSKDDCSDLVDTCVSLWKKYDTNCDMKLSLKTCFEYIEEISVKNNAKTMKIVPDECVREDGWVDLQLVKLSGAYASNVMVSGEQEVHFLHAVKWALRVSLSQNNPEMLRELDEAQQDNKTRKLEEDQARRHKLHENMGEPVFLSVLVATAKIQAAFRLKQKRRAAASEHDRNKPRAAG